LIWEKSLPYLSGWSDEFQAIFGIHPENDLVGIKSWWKVSKTIHEERSRGENGKGYHLYNIQIYVNGSIKTAEE